MLVYGCALYGARLESRITRRLMTRRFLHLQQHAAARSVISAAFVLAIQGGLMGGGWPDVFPSRGAQSQNPLWRGLDMANYLALVTLAV